MIVQIVYIYINFTIHFSPCYGATPYNAATVCSKAECVLVFGGCMNVAPEIDHLTHLCSAVRSRERGGFGTAGSLPRDGEARKPTHKEILSI